MISLTGHLGARVSALVDGQLPSHEEERLWQHVLACPGCRRLVEHEGWTKRALGLLADPEGTPDFDPALARDARLTMDAWSTVEELERRSARRRTASVLVGGGAVGAAVLGLVAAAGPLAPGSTPARPSPAHIRVEATPSATGSATGRESSKSPNVSTGWARRSR